jgi:hypothetical protein
MRHLSGGMHVMMDADATREPKNVLREDAKLCHKVGSMEPRGAITAACTSVRIYLRAEAPESSHNLKNKKTIFCKQTLIKYHVFHPWKTFSNEQLPLVGEALASIEPSLILSPVFIFVTGLQAL